MQKKLTQIDLETGALEEGFIAVVQPKRRNAFTEGWFAMAQNAAGMLKQITRAEDLRVMWALLERLDFENLIQVPQSELARDLNMDPAQVNRAIKRLLDFGAILEGPRIGRSRSYRLNPSFGWKGSSKGHHQALKERMEAAGMKVIQGGKQLDIFGDENPSNVSQTQTEE